MVLFHLSSHSRSWSRGLAPLWGLLFLWQRAEMRPSRQSFCSGVVYVLYIISTHISLAQGSHVHAWTWAGCALPLLRGAVKHMAKVGMCNWDETAVNKDAAYRLGTGLLVFFWSPSIPLSAAIQNLALRVNCFDCPHTRGSQDTKDLLTECVTCRSPLRDDVSISSLSSQQAYIVTHSRQNFLEGCWSLLPDSWGLLALGEVSCHIWRNPDCPEGYWLTSLV